MMAGMSKKPPMMTDDDEEGMKQPDEGKGGKLLALQNLLGAIEELSDEEIKPDIQRLMSQVHAGHEAAEGDETGMEEASEHEDMMGGKKPGVAVEIGMGAEKPEDMSEEDEEDKGGMPKGGFLAILSKKLNKK